ncbi:hypothetical protein ACG7TL_001731 [Trametes sanguinea]
MLWKADEAVVDGRSKKHMNVPPPFRVGYGEARGAPVVVIDVDFILDIDCDRDCNLTLDNDHHAVLRKTTASDISPPFLRHQQPIASSSTKTPRLPRMLALRLRAPISPVSASLLRSRHALRHAALPSVRLMSTESQQEKQYEFILTSRPAEGVALITLNRPKALNALSTPLFTELNDAVKRFDEDDSVRALVLTGSDRAFAGVLGSDAHAAGADIKEMKDKQFSEVFKGKFLESWGLLTTIRKPIIAAVSGYALGGGCELALMCDIILASPSAKFGQPEINIGVIPGGGGSQRLAHAIGKSRAMEVVLTGRNFTAQEASDWGMVSRVVPDEEGGVVKAAVDMAAVIASKSAIAVQAGKEVVNAAFEHTLAEGLRYERRLFHGMFATKDQKEVYEMSSRAVEMSSGNPPWYVMDENGQIMPLEVPTRLKEHPELVRRGLEPVDPSKIEPLYYIKIVDTDTEEAAVYQRLSQCLASPNHTIPGEITSPGAGHPLLITPSLSEFGFLIMRCPSLYYTLAMFRQMIEDVCPDNIVVAPLWKDPPYPDVEPGKMYYIDFGSSLQLPLGPGVQRSILLGPSQYALRYDIHNFDPYSWDVYCAALTLRATLHRQFDWADGQCRCTAGATGVSLLDYISVGWRGKSMDVPASVDAVPPPAEPVRF